MVRAKARTCCSRCKLSTSTPRAISVALTAFSAASVAAILAEFSAIAEMYKWRHLVENFFCCLKAFRRIETRYEKTDACFAAILNLVAVFLASR